MVRIHKAASKVSRRAMMAGAATAVALVALAGTAARAQDAGLGTPDAPVEIRMIANEAFANQWQTLMVPEFNKHYPNIKVTIDGVPYVELLAKSMLDATGPSPTAAPSAATATSCPTGGRRCSGPTRTRYALDIDVSGLRPSPERRQLV